MFGSPGSLTMYSTAARSGLPAPNDVPPTVGPATYYVKQPKCRPCTGDTVAPFDTSAIRKSIIPIGIPSPSDYYAWQRPRYEVGSPIMRGWCRFPRRRDTTVSPGPIYKITDPWVKLIHDCEEMTAKRWRFKFDKYISNSVPSVFHPLELRSFVSGIDGRMYPVKNKNWKSKIPGPKYNTRDITTSHFPGSKVVDFWHSGGRPPLFRCPPGFGPADFTISRSLGPNGGIFLSQTDNPKYSSIRYIDFIMCKSSKMIYPTPLDHYIKSSFDEMSPKAVSTPFKSKVPRLGFPRKNIGPGPQTYFQVVMCLDDIDPPIYPRNPSYFTVPPEPVPFSCSQERFYDPKIIEETYCRPSPCAYDIPTFTDLLWSCCNRNIPAICNSKVGFLTSADARGRKMEKVDCPDACTPYEETEPKQWRNMRPRKVRTYPYHGAPPSFPGSPGPIYDTNPACKALKAKKDWWDPRRVLNVGFNCSGCTRKIEISNVDKSLPGPGIYCARKPPKRCSNGNIKTSALRAVKVQSVGPGPRHKIHEKFESSVWRATHLGTFNIYLKGVDAQYPWAGGFRAHGPLNHLADRSANTIRLDDYSTILCPTDIIRQK